MSKCELCGDENWSLSEVKIETQTEKQIEFDICVDCLDELIESFQALRRTTGPTPDLN